MRQYLGPHYGLQSLLLNLRETHHIYRLDDEIYKDFLESFPEYASEEWDGAVDEDEMKSADGKRRWRKFMSRYEKKVVLCKRSVILIAGGIIQFRQHITVIAEGGV